jgi:DNA-binding transcriptional MerR regulator
MNSAAEGLPFTETTSAISRASGASIPTIRLYGDLGLIQFIEASNGTRLHRKDAGERVAQLLRQRIANRGRRRVEAPVA